MAVVSRSIGALSGLSESIARVFSGSLRIFYLQSSDNFFVVKERKKLKEVGKNVTNFEYVKYDDLQNVLKSIFH